MILGKVGLAGRAGGKMIDSFTIRNFRSFKEISIDDCRRVNVLVGDNGSGKTALLEAIFLASGVSPEIVLRTRGWRGGDAQARLQGTPEELHDQLWSDLFYKFQTSKTAFVKLEGRGDENRSVTITRNKPGAMRLVPPSRKKPYEKARVLPKAPTTPIQFRWTIQNIGDVVVEPSFGDDGRLIFPSTPAEAIKAAFFASNRTVGQHESANRFSVLSQSFLEQDFIDRFNSIYPTISHLSLEVDVGIPTIFAKVDGLPRKIPLSLASGGMSKLVAILLGIASQANGVILIDEIENGFYYKHMDEIWRVLLDFARLYSCQLFISTHSAECLSAVAKLAEESPDDFCMLRAVQSGEGTIVRQFAGKRFASAVLGNVEVR